MTSEPNPTRARYWMDATLEAAIRQEDEDWERFADLVESFADALAAIPSARVIWECGDGDGGCAVQKIRSALLARGVAHEWKSKLPTRIQRRPISGKLRTLIYERDEYACVECGVRKDLTLDHIVPVIRGGTDEETNLRTLCRSCNSTKGAR